MRTCVVLPATLLKAKYTRRWKGKDGKWHYEYGAPEKKYPQWMQAKTSKERIKIDAIKRGWNKNDAKKFGIDLSKKNPGKYITMHDVFGEVTFTVHDSLPKSVYAPGDFTDGYAVGGIWKNWSAKRKVSYSNKMIEGPE
jgi:hypothetical protein